MVSRHGVRIGQVVQRGHPRQRVRRTDDQDQTVRPVRDIVEGQPALPLCREALAARQQAAERCVGRPVGRQGDDLDGRVGQDQPGADEELRQRGLGRGFRSADLELCGRGRCGDAHM